MAATCASGPEPGQRRSCRRLPCHPRGGAARRGWCSHLPAVLQARPHGVTLVQSFPWTFGSRARLSRPPVTVVRGGCPVCASPRSPPIVAALQLLQFPSLPCRLWFASAVLTTPGDFWRQVLTSQSVTPASPSAAVSVLEAAGSAGRQHPGPRLCRAASAGGPCTGREPLGAVPGCSRGRATVGVLDLPVWGSWDAQSRLEIPILFLGTLQQDEICFFLSIIVP